MSIFIVAAILFTSPAIEIRFGGSTIDFFSYVSSKILPTRKEIDWFKINIICTGGILLLNEANFFIRYFFDYFAVIPKKISGAEAKIDEKEYSAGRVIGMLERVLIYFFVLIDQYAAIGFIIAAKGFTRFKELDEREFAEYVLIGTLLSATTSIFTAVIVRQLLNW